MSNMLKLIQPSELIFVLVVVVSASFGNASENGSDRTGKAALKEAQSVLRDRAIRVFFPCISQGESILTAPSRPTGEYILPNKKLHGTFVLTPDDKVEDIWLLNYLRELSSLELRDICDDEVYLRVSQLRNCSLSSVTVRGTNITDQRLAYLSSLKTVRQIVLMSSDRTTSHGVLLTSRGVRKLRELPKLKSIFLWKAYACDSVVRALRQVPVSYVAIIDGNVSYAAISCISKNPALRYIHVEMIPDLQRELRKHAPTGWKVTVGMAKGSICVFLVRKEKHYRSPDRKSECGRVPRSDHSPSAGKVEPSEGSGRAGGE